MSCSENGSVWMVPPNLGPPKNDKAQNVKKYIFIKDVARAHTHTHTFGCYTASTNSIFIFRKIWFKEDLSNCLISQSIHDDMIGHNAERMNFLHEDVGRDHMEVDVLEEAAQDLRQLCAVCWIAVLLAPHQSSLEIKIKRIKIYPIHESGGSYLPPPHIWNFPLRLSPGYNFLAFFGQFWERVATICDFVTKTPRLM